VSRRAAVLFVAIGLVSGVPYMLVRAAVEHLEPATLVFARTAIGACVLLPVAAARGELRPLLPRWKPLVAYTVQAGERTRQPLLRGGQQQPRHGKLDDGCLVLGEPFTAATAGGFVLVLAGSYLATRGGRHDVGLEAPALGAEVP
jgi:drug/metabolite transporter (DMT)-like permease